MRYPYQKARDRGCLQWIGYWDEKGAYHPGAIASSWGEGTLDSPCGATRGHVVTKFDDRCLGQERCFVTTW